MEKVINIGGRLHNPVVGGAVTGADEIKDDLKGKMQSVINQETDAALVQIDEGKQDKLTFDQTPTEGSTNPVTSGGVYDADAALQQAIEAILLLIPSAASALNQLADKAFVNSSISTATATFRGTYNSVTDLHLAIDATHQQIADALLSTVATADNNDYCYVQVPVSSTTFDIRRTERYKFNGIAWAYEYDLNTSGYTAAQWAAINSGITQALVGDLVDIKSYIPAEATSLNQLADKAYVVAQILAGIPAFKGQFTTLADLQAVSSPKAGDIGIVRTKDYDGYDVFTFYQYLNSQWNVYYTLQRHPQVKPATTGATGDYPYNGMGCIELPKNIVNGVNVLTQEMISAANTKYVIKYDYELAEDITVPANCVLEFDGGSINGDGTHTFTGNNTSVEARLVRIFGDNITLAGAFNTKFYVEWFGAAINKEDNSTYINNAIRVISGINNHGYTLIITGAYKIKDTIVLRQRCSLEGVYVGKKENSGYNDHPHDSYEGSGFIFDFTDTNKWALDEDRNGSLANPQKLYMDNSDVPSWSYLRKEGFSIKNIQVVQGENASPILGGIRFSNAYNAILSHVEVVGTHIGFCLNQVTGVFEDVYCNIALAGFYFGWNSTKPTLIDCFVESSKWITNDRTSQYWKYDKLYSLSEFTYKDSTKLFPPYCNVETAGFLCEGRYEIIDGKPSFDYTTLIMFGGGCQYLDALYLGGYYAQFKLTDIYLEGTFKTICWVYSGVNSIYNGITQNPPQESYTFGTVEGKIYSKDIFLSRCYPTDNTNAKYVIDNDTIPYVYYDDYVIDAVNQTVTNRQKTDCKEIKGHPEQYILLRQNNYGYPNRPDYINLLRDAKQGCYGSQFIDTIPNYPIEVKLLADGFPIADNNGLIENKDITIINNSDSNKLVAANRVNIKNTKIICGTKITLSNRESGGTVAFNVFNKCYIEYKTYITPSTAQIVLSGTESIDLTLKVNNINNVGDFVSNLDFGTKYIIRFTPRDGVERVYTNITRPTAGNTTGDVFIENGTPIYYTGDTSGGKSGWVDATGATV